METHYCQLANCALQAAAAEEMQTSRQGEESLLQPQSSGRNPCLYLDIILDTVASSDIIFFESGDCGGLPQWLYSLLECSQNEAGMVHPLAFNAEFHFAIVNGELNTNQISLKVMSKRLPHTLENVCLSTDEECQM